MHLLLTRIAARYVNRVANDEVVTADNEIVGEKTSATSTRHPARTFRVH